MKIFDGNENRTSRIIAAFVLFVLNIGDLVTTFIIMSHGLGEMNPWTAHMMDDGTAVVVKVGITLLLLYRAFTVKDPKASDVAFMWCVAGIYIMVVGLNIWQITLI